MAEHAPDTATASLPPQAVLYQLATGYYVSQAISVAATLGIADLLAHGPKGHDELARHTATHAPSLRRVLRLLASAGVLNEEEDGRFALTAVGECLRGDLPGSFRPAALLFTGAHQWQAWGDLLYGVQTGKVPLHRLLGGMDAFAYWEQHPEESVVFDEAMASFTALVAMAVAAVYDFSALGTVVDVGGGNGALLIGILRVNPTLRGVVFDMPRATEAARRKIQAAGLAERCQVEGGDFFAGVPRGGDAYLLKHVIHDWNDTQATEILRNCRRAMTPAAKLLIIEGVYPARVDQSLASRGAALNDVNMLVATGGRQRSEAEFRELFAAAGFRLERIVPTLAAACVIEAVPA